MKWLILQIIKLIVSSDVLKCIKLLKENKQLWIGLQKYNHAYKTCLQIVVKGF